MLLHSCNTNPLRTRQLRFAAWPLRWMVPASGRRTWGPSSSRGSQGQKGARLYRRLVGGLDRSDHWRLSPRCFPNAAALLVLQHITSTLSSLSAGWEVDLDSFLSPTPRGKVPFTNIVATLEPSAPRRLILACHYDSKALPPDPRAPDRVFLGASDSAVPCAMILELATSLDSQLKEFKKQVCAQLCLFFFFVLFLL